MGWSGPAAAASRAASGSSATRPTGTRRRSARRPRAPPPPARPRAPPARAAAPARRCSSTRSSATRCSASGRSMAAGSRASSATSTSPPTSTGAARCTTFIQKYENCEEMCSLGKARQSQTSAGHEVRMQRCVSLQERRSRAKLDKGVRDSVLQVCMQGAERTLQPG